MKKLKRNKGLTHVETIRIATKQIIRILVKIKAVMERLSFNFQTTNH